MHLMQLRRVSAISAFTLIELLVVIAIIAILAVVVVLTLNPAQLLAQSRDANRVADMATLNAAIGLYQTDFGGKGSMGSSSIVYVSLPDATISGNATSACSTLGLPGLPTGYLYQCASPQGIRDTDGTGWIPVNFQQISSGAPFGSLPVDPTNTSSSRLFYTYNVSGTQYEVTASMESAKYKLGGSNDVLSTDGGTLASVYEKGTKLGLEPIDFGDPSLAALWTMDEGTNGFAYDSSGNRATGTWAGTQAGTSGFYSPGKVGSWAGYFNGTNDYISSPNAYININSFTMAAWINPSSAVSGVIIDQNGGTGYRFFYSPGQVSGLQTNIGGNNWAATGYNPPLNAWTHVVLTYDGSNMNFYVNGVLSKSTPVSMGAGVVVGNTIIGAGTYGSYQNFPGLMDDVRLYTRALTAAEIQALYNLGK